MEESAIERGLFTAKGTRLLPDFPHYGKPNRLLDSRASRARRTRDFRAESETEQIGRDPLAVGRAGLKKPARRVLLVVLASLSR